MASIEAHTSRDWELMAQENEPLLFSDDENDSDYNYYTDPDEDSDSMITDHENGGD